MKEDDFMRSPELDDMLQSIAKATVKKGVQVDKGRGTPVFTEQDIGNTQHMLAKILRAILVDNHVTAEEMQFKQVEFLTTNGVDKSKFSSAYMNLIGAYSKDRITWKKFHEILVGILGFDMDIEVSVTRDGEKESYKFSDLMVRCASQSAKRVR